MKPTGGGFEKNARGDTRGEQGDVSSRAAPVSCKTCHGAAVVYLEGGLDACPECTGRAEAEYRAEIGR